MNRQSRKTGPVGVKQSNICFDAVLTTLPWAEKTFLTWHSTWFINNSYQKASKVLLTFVPDKHFDQLIATLLHSLTMLKTTSAEFQSIDVWFTDQNNRPLEIEDNVSITLIIR